MARLLYACRFDVSDKNGISEVLGTYNTWITNHYKQNELKTLYSTQIWLVHWTAFLMVTPFPRLSI